MISRVVALSISILSLCLHVSAAANQLQAVQCEGEYAKHLQGVCTNDANAIYWSFTTVLVKTDTKGHILRKASVADHHGDLCFHDGKVYVAVNLGQFNLPAGRADSWVYVYDGDTLRELARHKVSELVHGAGGIAIHGGRFFVVGGLPVGVNENYVYEFDESFVFRQRHTMESGYTLMGIQTVTFANDHWWFGCYGNPRVLLKADKSFKLAGKWNIDCSLGIAALPDGRIFVAQGAFEKGKGYIGKLRLYIPDDESGLRPVSPSE